MRRGVAWGGGLESQRAGSMKQMSSQMKDIRAQMEEDEDLNTLMRGLRGQGMNEDDFAAVDTKMRLIEVSDSAIDGSTDSLPQVCVCVSHTPPLPAKQTPTLLAKVTTRYGVHQRALRRNQLTVNTTASQQEYDPEAIATYWSKRPGAVLQRIVQLLGVSGSFLASIAADITFNKVYTCPLWALPVASIGRALQRLNVKPQSLAERHPHSPSHKRLEAHHCSLSCTWPVPCVCGCCSCTGFVWECECQ